MSKMSKVDEEIRAALRAEGGAGGADLPDEAEPQLRELIGDTFRGRLRWLNLMGYAIGIVFTGGAVFALVRFLGAEEERARLLWAMALVFCLMTVSLMKVWFWLELQKGVILREVKRLELQVARLASRSRDGSA